VHLTRYALYRRIAEVIPHKLTGRILGISGIAHFERFIDRANAEVVNVAFPTVDMQQLPLGAEEFDVVISDQVLPHLENPHRALSEAFRVLKRGGLGIHTARASGPLDPCPHDCCRFTKEGLLATCPPGLDVIQLGSWGNRYVMGLLLVHDGFFRYMQIPERPGIRRWLATCNEEKFPIHTWIVARKA
jgi:SAM-dependent methyltransferase